jgi:acylphosphatase
MSWQAGKSVLQPRVRKLIRPTEPFDCEKRCAEGVNLASSGEFLAEGQAKTGSFPVQPEYSFVVARVMKRSRMQIFYSGHVQGVGFRYSVKTVAAGFEVVGTVRNLPDGRVELIAEGSREELDAFRKAIPETGLARLIRNEDVSWGEAAGAFRGFEIVR